MYKSGCRQRMVFIPLSRGTSWGIWDTFVGGLCALLETLVKLGIRFGILMVPPNLVTSYGGLVLEHLLPKEDYMIVISLIMECVANALLRENPLFMPSLIAS